MAMLREQRVQLAFILILLLLTKVSAIAQDNIQSENKYHIAKQGTILISSEKKVWEIDPINYSIRAEYDKDSLIVPSTQNYIDRKNNFLYTLRKLSPDTRPNFGKFAVIQINLKTYNEVILFEGENPFAIAPHPMQSNQLIVSYIESSTLQEQIRSNPQYCFLDLQTQYCKAMDVNAAAHIAISFAKFPIYWLDQENFLANGGTKVNVFTGEAKPLLSDWVLFTLAPQYGDDNILVVAKPRNEFTDVENVIAGFYILDLKNLTLSKKLADTRPFDRITPLQMSADKHFVVYFSNNRPEGQMATVMNLTTGKVAFESPNTTLVWLPDSNNLVGAIYSGDPRHSTVIRVNAETGAITKLFEMDEQVNFTVVQ